VSLKVNPRWGQGRSLGFIDKHDREWSHRLTTAVGPTIYFGSRCDSRGAFRTPPMTDISLQIGSEHVVLGRHHACEFARTILALCGEEQ